METRLSKSQRIINPVSVLMTVPLHLVYAATAVVNLYILTGSNPMLRCVGCVYVTF
jgi:hypothetical protein